MQLGDVLQALISMNFTSYYFFWCDCLSGPLALVGETVGDTRTPEIRHGFRQSRLRRRAPT
jgi:hypothetical protein